jgi:GH35 family endo-1,4-beta-xylanase
VSLWDAINEPLWEPAFRNLPHRHWPHLDPVDEIADYVEPVLRWARDEDPDACYLVNDYGLQADSLHGPPVAADGTQATAQLQRKRFLELIQCMRERGVPPNAIGLQSHTGGWIDPATQTAVYDEMASAGLPLHITEFGASTSHLEQEGELPPQAVDEMQADYAANYLTCAFGHPAIEAFFFWGFMGEAIRWGGGSSHEPKPMFTRIRDLIQKEWTTREELATDAEGRVRFRGFLGDYALRYPLPGGTKVGVSFSVNRQQAMPLTIQAPFPAS